MSKTMCGLCDLLVPDHEIHAHYDEHFPKSRTDEMIERVFKLDQEASPGPWRHESDCEVTPPGEWARRIEADPQDARLIAEYRDVTPKLARALRVAIDSLETEIPSPREALTEIERIIEGEDP